MIQAQFFFVHFELNLRLEAAVHEKILRASIVLAIRDFKERGLQNPNLKLSRYLSMLLTLKCEVHPDTGEPLDNLVPGVQDWLSSLGSSAKTVTEAATEVERNPSGAVATAIEDGIQR